MIRYYIRYHSGIIIFRISPLKNKKDGIDFAMLLSLWASLSAAIQHVGKAGKRQIQCCQGFAIADYSVTLDALTLKPFYFCKVRGKSTIYCYFLVIFFDHPPH